MQPALLLQEHQGIEMYVPDPTEIQLAYQRSDPAPAFPYWAKIWPAALAMASFLTACKDILLGKKVLELAAGLGLPSLVAARYAAGVCCSDYVEEPLSVIRQSIRHNGYTNIHCERMNWCHLPENLSADILLLSDVNYDPDAFEALEQLCNRFISRQSTIILTTPQRLMAKPFIERLLPYCTDRQQMVIHNEGIDTDIGLFVLKK